MTRTVTRVERAAQPGRHLRWASVSSPDGDGSGAQAQREPVGVVDPPRVRDAIAGKPFEDLEDWNTNPRRWARGWRSLIFPGVFLLYLGNVLHGIGLYASGSWALVGCVALLVFAGAYLLANRARWGDEPHRFVVLFGVMVAMLVVEV